MKIHRIFPVVVLLVLLSLVLTGCGGTLYHTWPGVSVQGNIIYLANQGAVYAINADSGAQTWRYPKDNPDGSKPFFSPPTVTESMIVAGNYGHQVVAINLDGTLKWAFDSNDGHFVSSPLVINDTILAASSNNKLYALDMSGKQRWMFESKNMLWATPASDGTLAFVPALDHNLYALNLSDGKKVWSKDLGSALQSAPVLTEDGKLYVSTLAGDVVALNAQDGEILWKKPAGVGHLWASPLIDGETLYVGGDAGKITALSTKDGSRTWASEQETGSPVIGGGVLTKDAVVFPTEGGKLVYWSLDGSKRIAEPSVNSGKLYSTPVIAGDRVIAAITEGKDNQVLQAFGLDGNTGWPFTPK